MTLPKPDPTLSAPRPPTFMRKDKGIKPRQWIPFWDIVEYGLLRLASLLVNILPLTWCFWVIRKIGDLLYFVMRKRRQIAFYNLDIALGDSKTKKEKEKIARESFRNLATSLLEFFGVEKFLKNAEKYFTFEGTEYLDQAFARGKGVILVISHLGSWEYLTFLPYLKKYPCSVIGKRMKNLYIYEWVRHLRRSTSLNHIDKRYAVREVFQELKRNHLVALLIDQWASAEGAWIDFFGKKTSTTTIPARFAHKTGCALVPAFCLRSGMGRYRIVICPEIEASQDKEHREEMTTLRLNQWLEKNILLYPEQWIWTHRRWKGLENYRAPKAV